MERPHPASPQPSPDDAARRALVMWPRLDPAKLARTCGEPSKIARLIERRTSLPRSSIIRLLGGEPESDG